MTLLEAYMLEFDMAEHPWMPLYCADYLVDTRELSSEEHGNYLLLLMLAWRQSDGRLPDDEKWLRANLPPMQHRTFDRAIRNSILKKFFTLKDGYFENKRLLKEKQNADKLSEKQKKNADKRWSGIKENKDLADAVEMPSQSQSQSQREVSKEGSIEASLRSAPQKGSRLSDDWQPSEDSLRFAESEGLTTSEIEREASKFRDYWISRAGSGARKVDWSRTWCNWCRKAAENKNRGNFNGRIYDDSKSAGAAAGRLLELAKRGHFTFGPRPSLLPSKSDAVVELLPERRRTQSGGL
jgi:uncharacterized protein YdaU (DUF1376 family)